jgi:predicted DNA-binding transcriptional regulator AlpA
MSTTSSFITVPEIKEVLTVSESKAYRIVSTLNEELKKKGYMVIPGRVRLFCRYGS